LLVLQAQQARGELFLPRGIAAHGAFALRDAGELGLELAPAPPEIEQGAACVAHRPIARAQGVGRFRARALGGRELGLQLADARAQLAQVVLRGGALCGGIPGGRRKERRGEQQENGERGSQACFTLPWLATECIALAIASGSPR
jgi:hypothetical protein